jgi:radical SAM protein with 4Fe4S-binding SPASM domain
MHGETRFVEGNLREKPLAEIWQSGDAFAYNRKWSESQLTGFCRVCRYRDFCRGGCTWTVHCHKGEGGEGNPLCFYYQAVRQGRFDLLTEEPTPPELAFFGGKIQPVVPLAEGPTDAAALLAQARESVHERRFEEAHRLLLRALAQAPDDLAVIDLLGFVCFSLRNYEASESYSRRALTLKPDHAFAHNGLGLSLARQGRLAEGSAAIERAIALLPGWFEPYHDLAVILAEAGQREEACAVLARGAAAVPESTADFAKVAAAIRRQSKPV